MLLNIFISLNIKLLGVVTLINIWPSFVSFFKNVIYKFLPFSHSDKLQNVKWVLVTGATDGVGLKMAQELAKAGKGVIFLGRNKKKLIDVKLWFDTNGFTQYRMIEMDLSQTVPLSEYEQKWRASLDSMPQIDMLINNAAVIEMNRMKDVKYTDANNLISTNSTSTLVATNEYLKYLNRNKRTKSNILYISSGASLINSGYMGQYSHSKHFLNVYFRHLNSAINHTEKLCRITILYLGMVFTKLFTGENNYKFKDESEMLKNKPFGAISAIEAARSILWQSLEDVESHGHPLHFMQHASTQSSLFLELTNPLTKVIMQKIIEKRNKSTS